MSVSAPDVVLAGVSRETRERLNTYADMLRKWQRSINLVGPRTIDDLWNRHFTDSAQLLPFIPPSARILADFGSGAGFYVDATKEPYSKGYKMYSYITDELPNAIFSQFKELDSSRVSITGHSMGGHGALTLVSKR